MDENTQQIITSMMKEPWGYVAVGILAPLAEEVVFRGAIYFCQGCHHLSLGRERQLLEHVHLLAQLSLAHLRHYRARYPDANQQPGVRPGSYHIL